MKWRRTLFRPALDDPGRWPPSPPDQRRSLELERIIRRAAGRAAQGLRADYGSAADAFGATARVHALARQPAPSEAWRTLSLGIACADYHQARTPAPRAGPGGLTELENRRRWERLEPYLWDRLLEVLETRLAESFYWRGLLACIPSQWLVPDAVAQSLQRAASAAPGVAGVRIDLHLRPPRPGGEAWLRQRTGVELQLLAAALEAGRPQLLEVVRDPCRPPWQEPPLLAWAMGEDDDQIEIIGHTPGDDDSPRRLLLDRGRADLPWRERPPSETQPSPWAVRCWPLEPSDPPRFGLRRALRHALPWRLIWWLRHRLRRGPE